MVEDQGYMFKPPFKIRNKNGLVKLLKKRDLNGEGGVMYDEGGGNLWVVVIVKSCVNVLT